MLALWRSQSYRTRRKASPTTVELSERKFSKVMKALATTQIADSANRSMPRANLRAKVAILPFHHGRSGRPIEATVHDISSAGVAIILPSRLSVGTQFKMLISRRFRRSLEVLCTVRHCRPSDEGFIVGAEYGVCWLDTLGTLVGPGAEASRVDRREQIAYELAVA